ncbi:hypothetical protein ZIOFF_050726 [Zingiber officinale]|uniref:Uncharacterized protein n=1 Tax=Zingiber officinale TaxID=94328 RepID=A0A8J5FJB7_ZINOF|nr:hypothetical protein ZIOFF_050726 [Zingiber officinale]
MWMAAVVGAVAVYWFVWVMGSAKVKGKRAVNLKMGSIMRDKVQDKYKQYWSFFLHSKEGITAASDDDNVPAFVDTFYNLVIDIYEWGWGQSFDFSPSLPGRSHREATRIHEEPAADMRDGDLIPHIPIRGRSLVLSFTMTGKRTAAPFLLLLIAISFQQLRLSSHSISGSYSILAAARSGRDQSEKLSVEDFLPAVEIEQPFDFRQLLNFGGCPIWP